MRLDLKNTAHKKIIAERLKKAVKIYQDKNPITLENIAKNIVINNKCMLIGRLNDALSGKTISPDTLNGLANFLKIPVEEFLANSEINIKSAVVFPPKYKIILRKAVELGHLLNIHKIAIILPKDYHGDISILENKIKDILLLFDIPMPSCTQENLSDIVFDLVKIHDFRTADFLDMGRIISTLNILNKNNADINMIDETEFMLLTSLSSVIGEDAAKSWYGEKRKMNIENFSSALSNLIDEIVSDT